MKRLLLLPLVLVSNVALSVTMTNLVQDGFGNPLPVRVIVTPYTKTTALGGTNVLGPSVAFNNGADGSWSIKLTGGFYLVQQGLEQPAIPVFANLGDPQTNGFVYFASAATNPIPSFAYGAPIGVNVVTSTITYFDANSNIDSVANGSGALTNNGSGTVGWYNYFASVPANNNFTGYNTYTQFSSTTNTWSGAPTNVVDMAGPQLMEISTFTSVAITGIINKSTADAPVKTLKFFNASATNQTVTLDSGITTRDGLRQYVNTNGQTFIISIQWDPGLSQTNSSYVRGY